MRSALLEALQAAREAGQPVSVATCIEGDAVGTQVLIGADAPTAQGAWTAELAIELHAASRTALRLDKAQNFEKDGSSWFVRPYNPPLRMIVVGAVHIAQPLVTMASEAGFAVTVVDPRAAFAAAARFPGVDLLDEWPDDALRALRPDVRTAVVTLTHDPKLDDPALTVALRSDAFYIGSLGSARSR